MYYSWLIWTSEIRRKYNKHGMMKDTYELCIHVHEVKEDDLILLTVIIDEPVPTPME